MAYSPLCCFALWLILALAFSPSGSFALWLFRHLADMPTGSFAPWLVHPWLVRPVADSPPCLGRFAPGSFASCSNVRSNISIM